MQRIKTLVAIAATALAAMAAFSAVSASAGTVLCSKAVTACAQTDIRPSGTQLVTGNINYEERGFTFTAGGVFHCTDNLITVKTTMKNGNPLPGEFQSIVTAPKCTVLAGGSSLLKKGGVCSSVTMNQPPTTVTATSNGQGTVSIGSAAQPLTISLTCDFIDTGIKTCNYKATDAVTMTVAESATIKAVPLEKTTGGPLACLGSGGTLDVANILDGESTYIAKATETVLCEQQEWSVCPNSQILPAGASVLTGYLKGGQGFKLAGTGIYNNYIDCENFGIRFDTSQQSGAPLAASTTYAAVQAGTCMAAPFFGGKSCTSVAFNAPPVSMEATGSGKGTIQLGTASQPLKIGFTCSLLGNQSTCEYAGVDPVSMQIDYAENTSAVKAAPMARTQGEAFCPATVNFDLNATVSAEAVISSV